MSLSHGSSIVTDGLLFYYDQNNTQKSWKGKPTTNYLSNPTAEVTKSEFGQYYNLVDIFETNGLVPYSLSFDMKATKSGNVTWYMQNSSYTKYYFVFHDLAATTEWQRFKIENITPSGPTAAWLANTPTDNRAMLATYTGYGSGVFPNVKNMQLELGPFATSFVDGTRSNTQAILDLTGNNTITANSLTYASDGSFSFVPANSNRLSVPLATAFNKLEGTINLWVYPQGYNGGNGYFVNKDDSTANALDWFWIGPYGDYFYFRLGDGSSCCNNDLTLSNYSSYVPLNAWKNICVTWKSGQSSQLYINGILKASRTISVIPNTNPSLNGTFGLGHAYADSYFNGKMPLAQIYNRCLSANEIQQNFNATRGRYGL